MKYKQIREHQRQFPRKQQRFPRKAAPLLKYYSLNFIHSASYSMRAQRALRFSKTVIKYCAVPEISRTNRSCDLVIRYWRRFLQIFISFISLRQATLLVEDDFEEPHILRTGF
jgi:hypothetical protein